MAKIIFDGWEVGMRKIPFKNLNMGEEIFISERYFVLFDYLVSHGQLLLRSDKRKGYDFNLDVIFYDTHFIQMFSMLNGISIRLIDKPPVLYYENITTYLKYENNNIFEIESAGEKFFIAASYVRIFENNLEFNKTSLDFEEKDRGREIWRIK